MIRVCIYREHHAIPTDYFCQTLFQQTLFKRSYSEATLLTYHKPYGRLSSVGIVFACRIYHKMAPDIFNVIRINNITIIDMECWGVVYFTLYH